MALFQPGIHENLSFKKFLFNEHGSLEITIGGTTDPNARMTALLGNTTLETAEQSFRFYPPSLTEYQKPDEKRSVDAILGDLLQMRKVFLTYAEMFAPKADCEAAFGGIVMFTRLGVTQEQVNGVIAKLQEEKVVKAITKSLSEAFVNFMLKLPNWDKLSFRHKFWRQSEAKTFATIPNSKDLFVEPMTIPKAMTKVVWTPWELENKKDSNAAIASDAKATNKETSKSLFNAGAEVPPATKLETVMEDIGPGTAVPKTEEVNLGGGTSIGDIL